MQPNYDKTSPDIGCFNASFARCTLDSSIPATQRNWPALASSIQDFKKGGGGVPPELPPGYPGADKADIGLKNNKHPTLQVGESWKRMKW